MLNKNDMSQSYTLLNDKGNVIRGNRRHLKKMDSNFVKIGNDNDMDNDTESKPKTRHTTSATEPGELDAPQENATLNFEKHRATNLHQEEEQSKHLDMMNSEQ